MKTFTISNLGLLLWAKEEMDRQMKEGRLRDRKRLFGEVEECPCGCGLAGDVCNEALEGARREEELPF